MKKLLPSAVLALVVSGVVTAQSFAGCCFGLLPRMCGCCGCGAKFCVRQYNAFSPVCCGTVFCDGCCPFGAGGGYGGCADGMCGPGGCGLPFSGIPAGACGPNGCDGGCLGSLPPSDPTPGAPAAPTTTASPLPSGPTSLIPSDRPIQNATYRPASFTLPAPLAPVQMQPQTMAAPSYWGN
jgi:hypothetical protein